MECFLKETSSDIILLSEHWMSEEEICLINFDGFKLCASYCREKSKHGGVAIYCKTTFKTKALDFTNFSISNVLECCGIEVIGTNIIVIAVYRPPSGDTGLFLNNFGNVLNLFLHSNKFVVIGGDFNIDFNVNSTLLHDLTLILNCNNMYTTIHEPTRVTSFSSKCIDNIMVNDKDKVLESNIIKSNLSDHYAQYVIVTEAALNIDDSSNFKRFFNENNINNFCHFLMNTCWAEVYASPNCNIAFKIFMETISFHFETCFPLRKVTNKHTNTTASVPIFDHKVIQAKKQVSLFADLSRQYPQFKDHFKAANNEYRHILSDFYKDRNDKLVIASKNKSKAMWSILNNTLGKSKNGKAGMEIEENGKILNTSELTEKFNTFFINAPRIVTSDLPQRIDFHFIDDCLEGANYSLFLRPLSEEDVSDLILKLKNSNSSGHDEISNILLKRIAIYIIKPLTYLINLSLEQGIYPSELKVSKVIPLYKKGDPNLFENYRGISLSPSISKVFESAINSQLINFLMLHNKLSTSQHGFTKQKSIDTALSVFLNDIISTMDKGQVALGLFIDFSRAFDCVDHSILLTKLERYGVRGVAHDWFVSYLSNRYQQVCIEGVVSSLETVSIGVPQGSILGPTLFIIYINDMLNFIQHPSCLTVSYADDTNILIKSNTLADAEHCAKTIYDKVMLWTQKNKLCINQSKTSCIIFRTVQSNITFNSDILLSPTTSVKYANDSKMLGLRIDCNLKWFNHIHDMCGKLSKTCYALAITSKQCSESIVRQLYFASFHSCIKYGIVHWGSSSEAHRVFLLQKRAIRIIANLGYNVSCREAFKRLNILTLSSVYIYELSCFVYKNKGKFEGIRTDHQYNTRKKDLLLPKEHRTALYQKSLFFMGCKFFNILPEYVRSMTTVFKFKKALKSLLLDINSYTVDEFLSCM